ncbi:MAG TPA: hypothetical protein V6C64_08535 [Microcoleaceae cyanobacterium]|jgi:hypothetical protein
MGVSIRYNAIPPESPLYRRIQQDKPSCILLVSLFPYGNGIFNLFEIDPEEVYELFTDVIEEHHDTFGSEVEVDRIIAEFQSEIRRTRQAHPGIEDRTASLEKTSVEIEECLLQELSRQQIPNSHEVVQRLIFGDQDLPPNLLPEESFGLISREAVREGASIFKTD